MKKLQLSILAVSFAGVLSASADLSIDYNVGAWGPQNYQLNPAYPGDTLEMQAYSFGGLVLPDNTAITAKINTFLFTVDYSDDGSYGSAAAHNFTASRLMTITAPSVSGQTLSQDGTLGVTAGFDYVNIQNGLPIVFNFPGIGIVTVTPLALSTGNVGSLGTTAYDVNASFVFTPVPDPTTLAVVPEPTTVVAGALLLLPFGASAMRVLRRKS